VSGPRDLSPKGPPAPDSLPTGPHRPPTPDTRRFLARVLAVGAVIVALALVVWARACARADRCADAGGRWDEEWKVCRQ
jgi:hypothetical protein